MSDLFILRDKASLRNLADLWHREGHKIGLIPTMGALHRGHLSLVEKAKQHANRVIATIFVNPTQFGAGEDLDKYPREEMDDIAKLRQIGCDAIYIPSQDEIYPEGFATRVEVDGLTDVLDGAARPGHFNGVTQIVSKLFLQSNADIAIFGEKDWQQLAIIKRMVLDLDMRITILGAPIMRDSHGLALSSRNAYLSQEELQIARQLNVVLRESISEIKKSNSIHDRCHWAITRLLEIGFNHVDYVECRDAETLELIKKLDQRPARLFAAAKIGRSRLIDNMSIGD